MPSGLMSLTPALSSNLGTGQEDPWQAPRPPRGPERPAGHEDRVLQHQRDQAADGEAGGLGAAAVTHRRLGGVSGAGGTFWARDGPGLGECTAVGSHCRLGTGLGLRHILFGLHVACKKKKV